MADVLRQSVRIGQERPQALAAGLYGARPELLIRAGGSSDYRHTIVHHRRGIGDNGTELGPGDRALPGLEDKNPRSALSTARVGQCRSRANRQWMPLQ